MEALALYEWPALAVAAEKVAVVGSVQLGNQAHMPPLFRISQQGVFVANFGEDPQMPHTAHLRNGEAFRSAKANQIHGHFQKLLLLRLPLQSLHMLQVERRRESCNGVSPVPDQKGVFIASMNIRKYSKLVLELKNAPDPSLKQLLPQRLCAFVRDDAGGHDHGQAASSGQELHASFHEELPEIRISAPPQRILRRSVEIDALLDPLPVIPVGGLDHRAFQEPLHHLSLLWFAIDLSEAWLDAREGFIIFRLDRLPGRIHDHQIKAPLRLSKGVRKFVLPVKRIELAGKA
ncbi:Uncharacterised protein [uncultured archaeon]|nr:Uncharacterised protein [uncultured archaeon]